MKKLSALLTAGAVFATGAMADVTVDTTQTVTDLGIVFSAVLGVAVIIFGYKKIQSLL